MVVLPGDALHLYVQQQDQMNGGSLYIQKNGVIALSCTSGYAWIDDGTWHSGGSCSSSAQVTDFVSGPPHKRPAYIRLTYGP